MVEDDVIPLEITGSVKVYNQAFVDKQEKRIAELEGQVARAFEVLEGKRKQITELEKENAELKILVSSMLYEINALWDISEMNEDVRKHAERIDSEVEK